MYRYIQTQILDDPKRYDVLVEQYPLKECRYWCERFNLTCREHTYIWRVEIPFIHWLRCFDGVFPYTREIAPDIVISSPLLLEPPNRVEIPYDAFQRKIDKYGIIVDEERIRKDPEAVNRWLNAKTVEVLKDVPAQTSRPELHKRSVEFRQWTHEYARDLKSYALYEKAKNHYEFMLNEQAKIESNRRLKVLYQEWARETFIGAIKSYLKDQYEEPNYILHSTLYGLYTVYVADFPNLAPFLLPVFHSFDMFVQRIMSSEFMQHFNYWQRYFPSFTGEGGKRRRAGDYYLFFQVLLEVPMFEPIGPPPPKVPTGEGEAGESKSDASRTDAIKEAFKEINDKLKIQFHVHDISVVFRHDIREDLDYLLPSVTRTSATATDLFHGAPDAPISQDEINQIVEIIKAKLGKMPVLPPASLTGIHATRLEFWKMVQSI